MKLELSLRYTEEVQRPPVAWFIPSADPREWLAEICLWNVPQRALKLLVIHARSEQPLGVLVVLGNTSTVVAASPLCRPYGVVAQRLFLPVEAKLEPVAMEEELARWLPSPDGAYVWHPTAGLIGFAPQDSLRISDLLAPPALRAVNWDRAQPGVKLNQRLVSIEPEAQLSIANVIREAGGDIGDSAEDIDSLPPHPSERGAAGKFASEVLGSLARALNWMLKKLPVRKDTPRPPAKPGAKPGRAASATTASSTSGGSLWAAKLQHWAAQTMQRITESIQIERHRQLARLLRMLEKDPDLGLKYALPLTGDGAPRGLATPGSRLTPRDTSFNMGRLGGGGPVDVWDTGEYRAKLSQRYRELANRELALGRYRRAAYIFAELLGDLTSAAAALESGEHYREAAALYDQRLHQPQQAARCLVKGRLWSEAIAIYERLGQHEQIGDLYAQLDDPEQATAAYEQAVDQQLQRNDYLAAAALLERKLRDTDRAYRCLFNAWPGTPQGPNCLEAAFVLLGRHQRYDEADQLVRHYSSRELEDATAMQWIERLSHVATDFPHAPLRELAADRTRVLVAQRLEQEQRPELSALTAAVARLVPSDRLLARDSARYLQKRLEAQPRVPPRKASSLVLLRGYHLPSTISWRTAIEVHKTFYAAGWRGRELCVLRGGADDVVQSLAETWTCEHATSESEILLAARASTLYNVIVHPRYQTPVTGERWFSPMGRSFDDRMSVGPHPSLTPQTIGVHYGDAARVTCVDLTPSAHIVVRSHVGGRDQLAGTLDVDLLELLQEDEGETPIVTQLCGTTVLISAGHWLIVIEEGQDGRIDKERLLAPILSIACSGPYGRQRMAIGFEQGAQLFWSCKTSAARERFAHDLASPVLAFTDGGYLVAAAEQGIEVYTMHDNRLTLLARQPPLFAPPLAIFSGQTPHQFRILFRDGRVRVYGLAERT
jgi:tetratricopeptide (TPR) repeat protein